MVHIPILDSWGSHNKAPQTGRLKEHLLSPSWSPSSEIQEWARLASPEASLPSVWTPSSHYVLTWFPSVRVCVLIFSHRDTGQIAWGHSSDLILP